MSKYADIIRRLEEAEGPSRELNLAIFRAVHPEYDDYVEGRGGLVHPDDGEDQRVLSDIRWPAYTASLDAAIALVERKLPGCYREISGPRKYLNIPSPVPNRFLAEITTGGGFNSYRANGWGASEPIALLRALFKALQAQEASE